MVRSERTKSEWILILYHPLYFQQHAHTNYLKKHKTLPPLVPTSVLEELERNVKGCKEQTNNVAE
jgi:hypothetical protein